MYSEYITFYKIYCLSSGNCYIGATGQPLKRRIINHRANYKQFTKGNPKYHKCSSFDIIAKNNYKVVELKKVLKADISLEEAKKIERKYVEDHLKTGFCLNSKIPNRTRKEYMEIKQDYYNAYMRKHYENPESRYRQYKKNYYILKRSKAKKIRCELCGGKYMDFNFKQHEKTKKHRLKAQFQQQV